MKVSHLPAVLERAEKDHDFPGKIHKTRQADRSKYTEAKSEAGKGHHFAKPAQLIENQRARLLAQFSCQGKQEVNMRLCVRRNLTEAGGSLQRANVKTACRDGETLIKENQAEEQNEAANCQVNSDLPRCRDTISAAPDPDQQKCGD